MNHDAQDKIFVLQELLTKLYEENISKDNIKEFIEMVKKLYEDGTYRHQYSQISGYLYQMYKENPKEMDLLQFNIEELYKRINENTECSDDLRKSFNKLYDHVMLECTRISQLYSLIPNAKELDDKIEKTRGDLIKAQEENGKIKEDLEKAKEENSKIKEDLEKTKDDMDKSTVSSITVLSIFTGIVMAFVGGFSILGSAFSNTELFETRVWLLILLMSLVGFVFFNTIFMFIYMVAKLSGKKLSVQCKAEECVRCRQCETCVNPRAFCLFCKLWKKYPYVLYVNVVLIICIIASGLCGIFLNKTAVPVNVVQNGIDTSERIDINVRFAGSYLSPTEYVEKDDKVNPMTGS